MFSYKIAKLQVKNFRNLQHGVIDFAPNINCILGANGNGKTNILEAVHVLTTKRSFRKNARFPQYLGIDGEKPEILFSSVLTLNEGERISYTGKLMDGQSEWFLDGKSSKKKLSVATVFINPFDSHGFHHYPSQRREWFDRHISMFDKEYKISLGKYKTLLKFRNSLLAERPSHCREQLSGIDQEMSSCAYLLTQERVKFLKRIEPFFEEIFHQIFCRKRHLRISLQSGVLGMSRDDIFDMMQSNTPKDLAAGKTTWGVHRDDYVLLLDGLNSYDYNSLGQQKMSYLSLLFAYVELFRYKFNAFPIVLIDDISGELDRTRWVRLVEFLERGKFQALVTTANENFEMELEKIVGANKLLVQNGAVKRISRQSL